MKPENLNEKMTENMRELTLAELEQVSGASGVEAKEIIGGEIGGLAVAVFGATTSLASAIKSAVYSK